MYQYNLNYNIKLLLLLATTILLSSVAILDSNQSTNPFKQWQSQYNKYYSNVEEQYRLEIFNKNLELITTHNANPNKTYTMAINQFADLTDEEFTSFYLNKGTYVNTQNIELSKGDHPPEADWADKMNFIKNQGQCGSCWTFSAVGAVEGFLIIRKSFKGTLAEQQLVDCAKDAGDGCNGGDSDLALDYIAQVGLVYERDYPYTAQDGVCKVNKGKVFISSRLNFSQNEDSIKQGIANYPLSVSVDATNWKFYQSGVFTGDCRDDYHNHAVVAVGYDYLGNWKIRNSWGDGWGESGHIWLAPGNTCAVMTRVDGAI